MYPKQKDSQPLLEYLLWPRTHHLTISFLAGLSWLLELGIENLGPTPHESCFASRNIELTVEKQTTGCFHSVQWVVQLILGSPSSSSCQLCALEGVT